MKIHSEVDPRPEVVSRSAIASRPDPTLTVVPDRGGRLAVLFVGLLASLGVLPWLGGSMFADEGATLYSGRLSWTDLWAQSQHVDLVLLPYYVLIHFWMIVSGNIAWVRALSLLAFFGTIVVIGWTGLRLAGRWCGIIASVLTATSALLVGKSLNARPYELSTFLVVLCAVVLFRWLEDSRPRWFWAFSILALLATAVQLFSLLAPVAMLACVLVVRPELIVHRLRTLLAPVGLLAILSCAWVVACIGEVGQVNWIANESIGTRLLAEIRGPAVGEFYDFVLIVIAVVIVTRVAVVWTGGGREAILGRLNQDRDVLALTLGWAVIPTLVLSLVSFIHPIFSVRYVAASAPGAALFSAFVCVRTFPRILDPSRYSDGTPHRRGQIRAMAAFGVVAAVFLVMGSIGSASAQQEDLQGPAEYAAQHWENGDVIGLPDHAITSAVLYYLTNNLNHFRLWPQLGVRQPYVEGFDLSLHSSGGFPRRVWILNDGSVPGVARFERILVRDGYLGLDFKAFNGSSIALFTYAVPTTSVAFPRNGAVLRGTSAFLLAGTYSNGTTITKVQFASSGDGYHKKIIGAASFTKFGAAFGWNTTTVPNGSYSLQSLVTSIAGRSSSSVAITVRIDN